MAGRGRGSINAKLDTFRSAGELQEFAVNLLANAVELGQQAKENVGPNRARRQENLLDMMVHQTALAQETFKTTANAWQKAANVHHAVKQLVSEAPPQTFTQEGLVEKLQGFNHSRSTGENTIPTGVDMDCDSNGSIRGGHQVRLRTFDVQGHRTLEPRNGAWYQTSEAVKILYDLKHSKARIGKTVVEVWRSKTPPWIDISYEKLVKKVRKVEEAVRNTQCTVDKAITELIRDRVAVDKPAVAGRPYYISRDEFVHEMFQTNRQEEASCKQTAATVLQNAKARYYESRGLHAPNTAVATKTVEMYWQHMGGKEHPVRTKVSERSHARVQASRSVMHLFSYFFTIMHTHIIVAPVGQGKDPPPDNWAARLMRKFWKAPVMPIDPSCVMNSDTKTVRVKLNPSGKECLCYYVVRPQDALSGNTISYWKAGQDAREKWVFIESFDVMSGDGRWGAFCLVSPGDAITCSCLSDGALLRPYKTVS